MTATNDFLPFCTVTGASNLESQATYIADTQRTNGNQPGIASFGLVNKALRQSSAITSQVAQAISDILNQSVADVDGAEATILGQIKAAFVLRGYLPPNIQKFSSAGSFTYGSSYYFQVASANATQNAVYTNNGNSFTVVNTISGSTLLLCTSTGLPLASGTLTKFSGTGDATITFSAYIAPTKIFVKGVGGGGGGSGSGTAGGGTGGNGGATTFASTLLVANGGSGGAWSSSSVGGVGGTSSFGTGAMGLEFSGSSGAPAGYNNTSGYYADGGKGGDSPLFNGGAPGGGPNYAGNTAAANTGSGGGGAGTGPTAASYSGSGGGGGGGFDALITGSTLAALNGVAAVVVGSYGAGGTNGTSGSAGGAGSIGVLQIIEDFS